MTTAHKFRTIHARQSHALFSYPNGAVIAYRAQTSGAQTLAPTCPAPSFPTLLDAWGVLFLALPTKYWRRIDDIGGKRRRLRYRETGGVRPTESVICVVWLTSKYAGMPLTVCWWMNTGPENWLKRWNHIIPFIHKCSQREIDIDRWWQISHAAGRWIVGRAVWQQFTKYGAV